MPRKSKRPGPGLRYFKSTGEHAAAIGLFDAQPRDLSDFQAATTRVYELLRDGQWHDVNAIRAAAAQHEATRRLRELRQCGYVVERRPVADGRRTHEYRIANPEAITAEEAEKVAYFPNNPGEDMRDDMPHPFEQNQP